MQKLTPELLDMARRRKCPDFPFGSAWHCGRFLQELSESARPGARILLIDNAGGLPAAGALRATAGVAGARLYVSAEGPHLREFQNLEGVYLLGEVEAYRERASFVALDSLPTLPGCFACVAIVVGRQAQRYPALILALTQKLETGGTLVVAARKRKFVLELLELLQTLQCFADFEVPEPSIGQSTVVDELQTETNLPGDECGLLICVKVQPHTPGF